MVESKTFSLATLKLCIAIFILALCVVTTGLSVSASNAPDKSSVVLGKVYLQAGERIQPIAITSANTTVEDILESFDIVLDELDEVTPAPNTLVEDGDYIVLVDREYMTITKNGVLEYETVSIFSGEAVPGSKELVQEGRNGKGTQVIKQLVENGVVIDSEIISENIEIAPINEEIIIGFEVTPISAFDFNWNFNDKGEPIDPAKVLSKQVATAYTASGGAKTSTGVVAAVGYVAVNPNVIPYGSKLFIKSTDGSMIYGYAIAADTGGALMRGSADVDLFLTSYDACIQHGVKSVEIYILEYPEAK